jgi:hypothetical protein
MAGPQKHEDEDKKEEKESEVWGEKEARERGKGAPRSSTWNCKSAA